MIVVRSIELRRAPVPLIVALAPPEGLCVPREKGGTNKLEETPLIGGVNLFSAASEKR